MRQQNFLIEVVKKVIQDDGKNDQVIEDPNDRNPIWNQIDGREDESNEYEQNRFIGARNAFVLRDILNKLDELFDTTHLFGYLFGWR